MIENSVTCKKSLHVSAKRQSSVEVSIEIYVKEGMKKLGETIFLRKGIQYTLVESSVA